MANPKLSTKLLTAYVAVVGACLALIAIPMHALLRRDYVARAAALFEQEVRTLTARIRVAADGADREALDRICEELNVGFDGRVSVIAQDGKVVADSISARCAARARPECLEMIREHREGLLENQISIRDTVSVRVPLVLGALGPAAVRLALPLAPVQVQLRRMYWLLSLGGAAALALALVVGSLVARRIAQPVERMTEVAERIASGDFGCRVPDAGRDEIGRLAEAVDTMRDSLRQNLLDLTRERNQALAIVKGMSDGVVAVSAEGRVILANAAARSMLRIPEDTGDGASLASLPLPEILATTSQRVIDSGEPETVEIGDVAAGERVTRLSISPVSETTGSGTRGLVIVVRDMTEARRAETMGKDLVANASHELKTPLAVISSTADTLLGNAGPMDGRQREFLEIIARQSLRLQGLVEETLQLSQLDGGERLEFEAVTVQELIPLAAERLLPFAQQRGQQIEVDVPDGLPPVTGAPSLLVQAVRNLVDNALRYGPSGTRVRVTARRVADAIEVAVSDTGPGIPSAEQAHIFDRFVRGRQAQARGIEGTGLGLAIVARVAALHGGSIDIRSRPGEGSCFTLRVPLAAGATAPQAEDVEV